MSSFLRPLVPELALAVAASSLVVHGLNLLEPSPNPAFLVVICAAHLCATIIIRSLAYEAARMLTEKYGLIDKDKKVTNSKFFHLGYAASYITSLLLLFFTRSLGHSMGYQLPSYVHTFGYLALAGYAYGFSKSVINFITISYDGKMAFTS